MCVTHCVLAWTQGVSTQVSSLVPQDRSLTTTSAEWHNRPGDPCFSAGASLHPHVHSNLLLQPSQEWEREGNVILSSDWICPLAASERWQTASPAAHLPLSSSDWCVARWLVQVATEGLLWMDIFISPFGKFPVFHTIAIIRQTTDTTTTIPSKASTTAQTTKNNNS